MKNKFLFILSIVAILLLVLSQAVWVRQLIERDKARFEMELNQTLQSVIAFSLSKEVSGNLGSLGFQMRPANPEEIPPNTVVRGSFDTKEYQSGKNLGNFLVGAFAEDLLAENKVRLELMDSLFRKEFSHYTEIAAYKMEILKNDSAMRSVYGGENAETVLSDSAKGVVISVPLGKTGTYAHKTQVVFKPTVFTQRLLSVAVLSAVAVMLICCLLLYQLMRLRKITNQLEAQQKAVRGIVHDLKSPLAYVYTLLGMFEKTEQNFERKTMLHTSKTRVKYLSDKIEMLLSVIKSQTKKLQIHPQPYPFTKRCREIMEELQIIYSDKIISYEIEPSSSVVLMVDPIYFDGCVRNLLDNAVKYAGDSPLVKITIIPAAKETVEIAFADNGPGMDAKEVKRVFSDFYRGSGSSSLKSHGVGLAFTKQVVRAHSGKITVQSNPGEGSVFTITLPNELKMDVG